MKAKSTVPEKGKRLESPKVEPSKQPAAQVKQEDLDLREFPHLFQVNDILEKLYRTPKPSIVDCEDESLAAYKTACALLTYAGLAEIGLHAEGRELVEPAATWVMDSIHLQLDIVRLAGKRLYSLCEARDRALAEGSEAA